jgi:ribosomal-protein-alanine N-acetyltransferase
MHAPTRIETDRLILRKPQDKDAANIFQRYAADPDVARYLNWPVHRNIGDSRAFVAFSDSEWERSPAGPYLLFSRADGSLLGSTGLAYEGTTRVMTGYVLAKDVWGQGYATEALRAMQQTASELSLASLRAHCHPEHRLSRRVLEKCGFELEGTLRHHSEFPALHLGRAADVVSYLWAPVGAPKL